MNTFLKWVIFLVFGFIVQEPLFAKKKKANTKPNIQWLSIDEVEQKLKTEPRPIYVDIYTNWCGVCKMMDKKTLRNAEVIAYLNANFYCIRFNAEQKEPIIFKGETYNTRSDIKTNYLALDWMLGQASYPTSVFLNENFEEPKPVPGYLNIAEMEMVLHYFKENKYKTIPFIQFRNTYKSVWK